MELKSYQKKVIADLTRYLELLNETRDYAAAFRCFWQEKSAPSLGYYQDILPGVPNLCFKVPTGGGKTFIACNAIRPIFDALPVTKTKAVVWLVPSDAILVQTVKALKDPQHPYRQKIDMDFGGRVEVYTKQELLNGQNFNPTAVTEQLSVTFRVRPQFQSDLETLVIPQFFQVIPDTLFTEGTLELLEKEQLAEGFTLKGKAYDIDFAAADDEIAEVDVRANEGGLPKVFKMTSAEQRYFKEYFNSLPPESRVRQCKDMIFNQLNKLNMVDAAELKPYINRIVDDMDKAQIAAMEKAPLGYAKKIKEKIESLLDAHYRETFAKWLETERIVCQPSYRLPSVIHPTTSTDIYGGSLYEAEDGDINKLEQDLIMELTALPNVRWWHRNLSRHGFAINGYIKHYPDIMIMTQSGKVIFAETKGEHLKNDDSREKIELGRAWRTAAGSQYRYYMVFRDGENLLPGAVSMSQFVETIKAL